MGSLNWWLFMALDVALWTWNDSEVYPSGLIFFIYPAFIKVLGSYLERGEFYPME